MAPFAQLRYSFSALAHNVTKIYRDRKTTESLSFLVSNLRNYLCGTTTELSEEAVRDVFQRAMKDIFPSTTTKNDTEYNAHTFVLDEIELELDCALTGDERVHGKRDA